MDGTLAQVIALVAYGNAWLKSADVNAPKLFDANTTFQYVDAVKFVRYASKEQETGIVAAESTADWLTWLRETEAQRLWNIAFAWQRQDCAEYALSGLANSIPRAIQVDLPSGYELWYPFWQTGGPAGKIWRVEYRGLKFDHSCAMPLVDLGQVKAYLRQALEEAEAFALLPEANSTGWAEWFTKAQALLESEAPIPPFHPDMLPAQGYSLEARRVLAAATQANVFGGMGSWNDLGFSDPELQSRYQSVTARLYEIVKIAFVMASNSFA